MSAHADAALAHALTPIDLPACVGTQGLFIDGGSNLGEGVAAFYGGATHRCALRSPSRLYGDAWQTASANERAEWVGSLSRPRDWCVRSFEANPKLMPNLRLLEQNQRGEGLNVRYIDGLLGTTTMKHGYPRTVVQYRHGDPIASSATYFAWKDIHAAGIPPNLAEEEVRGPAYDVRQVVWNMLRLQPETPIALKLDLEGLEFHVLNALLAPFDPASPTSGEAHEPTKGLPLLCNVSFLYVEYHNLHANLSKYGLPWNESSREPHMLAYFEVGARVKAVMDTPGCKLRIHWRNFWNVCGDMARYGWMSSEQVTGRRSGGRLDSVVLQPAQAKNASTVAPAKNGSTMGSMARPGAGLAVPEHREKKELVQSAGGKGAKRSE